MRIELIEFAESDAVHWFEWIFDITILTAMVTLKMNITTIFLISQRQDCTCAGALRLPRVSHVNAALLTPPALLCLTVHFPLLTKSVTWDTVWRVSYVNATLLMPPACHLMSLWRRGRHHCCHPWHPINSLSTVKQFFMTVLNKLECKHCLVVYVSVWWGS